MEKYKYDFTTNTLTITKAFSDKAETDPKSAEYKTLMRFRKDFPNLKIERKSHRSPKKYQTKSGEVYNCNQYKNLTYENMEKFIGVLSNSEEIMTAYNYLRYDAGKLQTSTYALVRKWFIQQFPLYRKNPLFYLNNETKVIDISKFVSEQKASGEN